MHKSPLQYPLDNCTPHQPITITAALPRTLPSNHSAFTEPQEEKPEVVREEMKGVCKAAHTASLLCFAQYSTIEAVRKRIF